MYITITGLAIRNDIIDSSNRETVAYSSFKNSIHWT